MSAKGITLDREINHSMVIVIDYGKAANALRAEKRKMLMKINTEPEFLERLSGEQRDDLPSEDEIREIEFSHREMQQIRLRRINEALERLENGTFGQCLLCGDTINSHRLEVDPAVAHCLGCQNETEKGFKPHSL